MMEAIRTFWVDNEEILLAVVFALLICAGFYVLAWLVKQKIFAFILEKIDQEKHPVATLLLQGFRRPLGLYLKVLGILVALSALAGWLGQHPLPERLASFLAGLSPVLLQAMRIATILAATWGLVASSDISSLILRNARHKLDLHLSKSVSRFLSAIFNVVVVAVAAVMLLSELSYDINGLLAGLGLGGLTIALAAKDSAANFFGGLVLITEKPFDIGDWIVCSGVEGTVEDINLRSTKVRTAPGSLTYVPNATLAAAPITNWSGGMEKRRADFSLQLMYGTPSALMRAYIAEVVTMLETDPEVLPGSIVRFSDLAAYSLDIRVIFYTSVPDFAGHLRIRERINYALVEMAEKHGIAFAFPSQTLYLQPEDDGEKPKAQE
ncbi:MAG: mechanosensitive ion channel family protein [Oscillospiraceae bacterium]